MMKKIKKIYKEQIRNLREWARNKFFGLFLLNLIVMLLVLLRSAGYFDPFYFISVNFIVVITMILSILLLGVGRKVMMLLALFFWTIAFFFKFMNIDIWAERAGIYAFQALFLGVLLLLVESVFYKKS